MKEILEIKMQKAELHIKMQKRREDFKNEFKKRLYDFTLELISFIDKLPHDNVSKIIGDLKHPNS